MTCNLDYLSKICDMALMLIKLLDGRYTTSSKHGKVNMGSSLQLHDVFFVDGLKCHLISVSQMTRDSRCIFQITDRMCVIQERITRTLIEVGDQLHGLYFFVVLMLQQLFKGWSHRLRHFGTVDWDIRHRKLWRC